MDTIDKIQKLMALALNNPNEEESLRAAYRAVALLVEHQVPIGKAQKIVERKATVLTPEEKAEFGDVLSSLARTNPDEFKPATYYATTEIDDEFMKKRVILAWRKIREQRAILESEIRRYESETGRRFNGR